MEISIPDDVIRHLKPDAVFVLNKSDLALDVSAHNLQEALNEALSRHTLGTTQKIWSISLRSGEGTQNFLDGLAMVLKERHG